MKIAIFSVVLASAMQLASAQGAPSPAGQAVSPEGASAAERAVQGRHDKVEARAKVRAAKRAAKAASAVKQ